MTNDYNYMRFFNRKKEIENFIYMCSCLEDTRPSIYKQMVGCPYELSEGVISCEECIKNYIKIEIRNNNE